MESTPPSNTNQPVLGKKNIHLDPKCMSCSGQLAGGLLSFFKIACLAYSPSNIVFRSNYPII